MHIQENIAPAGKLGRYIASDQFISFTIFAGNGYIGDLFSLPRLLITGGDPLPIKPHLRSPERFFFEDFISSFLLINHVIHILSIAEI